MIKKTIFIKDKKNVFKSCEAYKIADGIYLHKRYLGKGNFSIPNHWSLSHASGLSIIYWLNNDPISLKKAIKKANKLTVLDWNKSKEYILNHSEYCDAVMLLRGVL